MERLLIGSAGSRSYTLWTTHRIKHKSSSLNNRAKGESAEAQVLIELIYMTILQYTWFIVYFVQKIYSFTIKYKNSIRDAHTPQPREIFLTPRDIEVLYQYKVQDTFRALSVI